MRNIVYVACVMLALITLSACGSSKEQLKADVEAANKECPLDLGMVGEMTSIEYDAEADEVVMTMTMNKDLPMKISALNSLKSTIKRAAMAQWVKDESVMDMMKEIASADSKVAIVMRSADGSESIKINVSRDEVKDLADGEVDPISPRDMLEIMVVTTNAQCPMTIDEVTVLSSVSIEGNNFVYNYSIDENYVSVADVEQNKAVLRASIKEKLSNPDQLIQKVVETCKNANAGLSYRYVGDISGDVSVINFSPSEL